MKHSESDINIVKNLFNHNYDIDFIAKPALIKKVIEQKKTIDSLIIELFCENPGHNFFKDIGDVELAKYRRERIKRLSNRS